MVSVFPQFYKISFIYPFSLDTIYVGFESSKAYVIFYDISSETSIVKMKNEVETVRND
jgi:hypothetical protein